MRTERIRTRSHDGVGRSRSLGEGTGARRIHDLTDAYLRGAGFIELERDMERATRDEEPLVLAFIALMTRSVSRRPAAPMPWTERDRWLRLDADALTGRRLSVRPA